MCALRLECFTNDAEISSKSISLFDGFESEKDIAYSRGVKDGAEAASKAFESEKVRTLAPLLEALNDIGFSQQEARQAAINSLQPLMKSIIETALPICAKAGFSAEVSSRVLDIVSKLPNEKINVFVPADALQSITEMLQSTNNNCVVQADEYLAPLEARVDWNAGFEKLNIGAVVNAIETATDEFFTSNTSLEGKHAR